MKLVLCGSGKFEKAFHEWNEYLTVQRGCVVYSLAVFPSTKQKKNWYNENQKLVLDLVHMKKISESDGVVVITHANFQGPAGKHTAYIGESTRREILWAEINDKPIYYDYQYSKHLGKPLAHILPDLKNGYEDED